MKNQYTLFTEVAPYYTSMLEGLKQAEEKISMMYLVYDLGEWSEKINQVLIEKQQVGVEVRIMVDLFGEVCDHLANAFKNMKMLNELRAAGVEINLFQPYGERLSLYNRLHIKLCAIDEKIVLMGGSNIGDYYTTWQDTNLRIEGEIGPAGHQMYDYVAAHSIQGRRKYRRALEEVNPAELWFGDVRAALTVPGEREDIAHELYDLISKTEASLYLRFWQFLPGPVCQSALLAQLGRGRQVHALISDRTRIPPLDTAGLAVVKQLVRAGGDVYRYTRRFMHSKIAWNEKGDILIGSANLEQKALRTNFEMSVRVQDQKLAQELETSFRRDCAISTYQTEGALKRQPAARRALSRLLVLAAPLL